MNTPTFDPDDPRLTAYALGESSPAEREEIERLLAGSPEARAEVEQIAAFAQTLEGEYQRENEAYWESRPDQPTPGKVVEFPLARRRVGWSSKLAPLWKFAAVIVALGTLTYFVLRRPSAPQGTTMALSRPDAIAPQPSPGEPPRLAPSPTDALAQNDAPVDADIARLPGAPPATASPAAEISPPLLAMDSDRARRDESAPRPAMPAAASEAPASRSSARRQAGASVNKPDAPGATATGSAGGSAAPSDRIGRSLVRIRTGDGAYVGGVMLTPDGWILAARSLPVDGAPPTVILADQRECPATVVRDESGGWCRLRIDATVSSAVMLATNLPGDKVALAVASTDQRRGTIRYSSAQARTVGAEVRVEWKDRPPTGRETSFVFNPDGELLAPTTATPAAKAQTRAKAAASPGRPAEAFVRPFSAAERGLLQPAR